MSVDLKLYLNPIGKLEDIIKTTAIIAGCKRTIITKKYPETESFIVTNVEEATIELALSKKKVMEVEEFVHYYILSLSPGELKTYFNIHCDINSKGQNLITATSTPLHIAITEKLLNIFGGELIYQDSYPEIFTTVKKGQFKKIYTDNENEGFIQKNIFLSKIVPVEPEDLIKARSKSAYQLEQSDFNELYQQIKINNIKNNYESIKNNQNQNTKIEKNKIKI